MSDDERAAAALSFPQYDHATALACARDAIELARYALRSITQNTPTAVWALALSHLQDNAARELALAEKALARKARRGKKRSRRTR